MFARWHLTHSFHSQCPALVPAPSPPSARHLLPGTSLTWSASISDRLEQCADQHLSISTFSMQIYPKIMPCPALFSHPLHQTSCWEEFRNPWPSVDRWRFFLTRQRHHVVKNRHCPQFCPITAFQPALVAPPSTGGRGYYCLLLTSGVETIRTEPPLELGVGHQQAQTIAL